MRHEKLLLTAALAVSMLALPRAWGADATPPPEVNAFQANTEVLDIPTASTMYGRMFALNLRMYRDGGVLLKASASYKNTLTGGFSFVVDNLIGSGSINFDDDPPVRAFVKFRVLNNPTLGLTGSIGWDDQAYDLTRGRGLYAVLSKDLSMGGFFLTAHGGVGATHLKTYQPKYDTNVFMGITGSLSEDFTLGFEWDDILRAETIEDNGEEVSLKNGSFNAVVGFAWDVGLRLEIGFKSLFKGFDRYNRIAKIVYTF